jgi:hypothetical protein
MSKKPPKPKVETKVEAKIEQLSGIEAEAEIQLGKLLLTADFAK